MSTGRRRLLTSPSADAASTTSLVIVCILLFSPTPSNSLPAQLRRVAARRSALSDVGLALDEGEDSRTRRTIDDDEKVFFQRDDEGGDVKSVVSAALGETAVLECEAGGTPGPTIHWVRHGRRLLQVRLGQLTMTDRVRDGDAGAR